METGTGEPVVRDSDAGWRKIRVRSPPDARQHPGAGSLCSALAMVVLAGGAVDGQQL